MIWDFLGGMFGTRAIEICAAMLGFINVVLIIRRSIWNYPFGIAMVILYAWIFYEYRLYSDALLQIFFLVIQVFGLVWWLQGRDDTGRVIVRRIAPDMAALAAGVALAGTVALGFVMATYTDADLPYWDATTTVLSVVAQTLMARRILESWLVWIAVDVLAIGIYLVKGLTPTAVLYTLFLILAINGYFAWRRSFQQAGAQPA